MKIKNALIPFVPITLMMIAVKLISLFGLDSDGLFLGMSGMTLTYIVIGLTLLLFLVCIVMNIFDRKTAQVYNVRKNPIAGILAILSGLAIAASSMFSVVSNQAETEYYVMTLITAALSIPAAIALIMMSKVHFSGKSTASSVSLFYVFPSLWGCAELVTEFLSATKVSISATDMTSLFCYIFLTLYLFSHSMIVSKIKGRHPVKACFIYGFPAAAVSITFGIYEIMYASRAVENLGFSTIIVGAELLILGLYAMTSLIEMSGNVLTNDEVEILDSMPDDDDPKEESYASIANYDDELVVSQTENINDINGNDEIGYVASAEDINDFIIGYDTEEEEEPIPYFTKEEMEKSADFANLFVTPTSYDDSEDVIKFKKFGKSAKSNKNEKSSESEIVFKNEMDSVELINDVPDRGSVNTFDKKEVSSGEQSDSSELLEEINQVISSSKDNSADTDKMSTADKKSKQKEDIDALLKSLDDLK